MKPGVESELERLVKQEVYQAVTSSDWTAPIVPVKKEDGHIRVCGDYSVTTNTVTQYYPVQKTEDLLATLNKGQKFSKIDLSLAFQQLELGEDSQELLTINTHKWLFRPSRLQFGVHSAAGIFQRELEKRLAGIPRTVLMTSWKTVKMIQST